MGFPCNQFLHEEPLNNEEIESWAQNKYGVTFPLFGKVNVNGDKTDPLFEYLKENSKSMLGSAIKWNYTKFLINKNGDVVKRYSPTTNPLKIEKDIENELRLNEN